MFRQICFVVKDKLCCNVQRSLSSTDFRIRIMPFLIKIFVFNCFWQYRQAKKSRILARVVTAVIFELYQARSAPKIIFPILKFKQKAQQPWYLVGKCPRVLVFKKIVKSLQPFLLPQESLTNCATPIWYIGHAEFMTKWYENNAR